MLELYLQRFGVVPSGETGDRSHDHRYNFLTVALEQDIRSDDAEALIKAISLLRGVLKVQPNVTDGTAWVAEERARQDLATKLWAVLHPKSP